MPDEEKLLEEQTPAAPDSSTPPAEDLEVRDIRAVDGSGDLPAPPEPEPVATATEEAAEEAVQSLRDAAGELGYDVSSYEDDAAVLNHLVQRARQSQSQEEQLRQYQQLMAAQPQQSPESSPEDAPLWNPPEFNPMWLTQVERDAEGVLKPTAGGTPETVEKVLHWAQYRQEQQDKFWSNPYEYMRPMIERVAREQAQASLQTNEDTTTARQLIDQNAEWIYEGDPSNRQFTPEGQLFFESAQQLPDATPMQQYNFAMSQVEKARMQRELEQLKSQQTAAQTHEQKKREAIGSPKPNSSGTLQDVEQNPDLSLKERMLASLVAAGINQIDFEGSI